jgi:hypothetical protein
MPRLIRPHLVREHIVERLVANCLDVVEPVLGFRPDVHLDWPPEQGVSRTVLDATREALDVSLARVAQHRGCTSAFVSLAWRTDTVEVCVVDDGIPTNRGDLGRSHLDAATGVEHDVDDFDDAGICQWWSIPSDLS